MGFFVHEVIAACKWALFPLQKVIILKSASFSVGMDMIAKWRLRKAAECG